MRVLRPVQVQRIHDVRRLEILPVVELARPCAVLTVQVFAPDEPSQLSANSGTSWVVGVDLREVVADLPVEVQLVAGLRQCRIQRIRGGEVGGGIS